MPHVQRKHDWESQLAWQIQVAGLPSPQRQYKFHPQRRWKADFAWPTQRLIAEVEGIVWKTGEKSRHQTGKGFTDDCEKYANAMLLGWRVLRVTPNQIKSGVALDWIEQLLQQPGD